MSWSADPATENQAAAQRSGGAPESSRLSPLDSAAPPGGVTALRPPPASPEPRIGKRPAVLDGKSVDVFTLTLGDETIELLPLRNWGQLDVYKWRVRGKLPGTPAGLEITPDHVKLTGEIVSTQDPEGCAKLEKLLRDWLAMERQTTELARKKAPAPAVAWSQPGAAPAAPAPMRFQVELDKEGLVHIHCCQGKEILATAGLSVPGIQSLVSQGLLRKPHVLKAGALHDWVELDGVLFSFEKGNNDAPKLARALNESYLPQSNLGAGQDVVVFANAASSTGFDIQFPAKVGGVPDNRRRPLTEEALELLQDPARCGVLQPGIVIKLARPTFIFKQKTADGGERYLERSAENLLRVRNDDDEEKLIDLSQPVNYLHLSAVECTALFNHPAINRHAKARPQGAAAAPAEAKASQPSMPLASKSPETAGAVTTSRAFPITSTPEPVLSTVTAPMAQAVAAEPRAPSNPPAAPPSAPAEPPNLWLKPLLAQQPIRFDWFTWAVYEKIAAWARNSCEGQWRDQPCWFIRLDEASEDPADPQFKGILLLGDGGFAFLAQGFLLRFDSAGLALGVPDSLLKAAGVRLLAVGVAGSGHCVFVVSDNYRVKFGVPEPSLAAELGRLQERGALLLSVQELSAASDPVEVLWTVPAEQANPKDPKAIEQARLARVSGGWAPCG